MATAKGRAKKSPRRTAAGTTAAHNPLKPMTIRRRARRASARWHCRWTVADDATLRRLWGEASENSLRAALGRTPGAIRRRAERLGLPDQHQGLLPIHHVCQRLGLHAASFWLFARDAGIGTQPLSPVQHKMRAKNYVQRCAVFEVCEVLLRQRDTRCQRPGAWSRLHGHYTNYMRDVMVAARLWPRTGSKRRNDVPVGVLDELAARRPGPWCDAWRKALSVTEPPCEPWLIALALHDFTEGDGAAEWTWALSQPVRASVRSLLPRNTTARRQAA